MILQTKIDTFINKAQSRIAGLALDTAEALNESYSDDSDINLAIDLVDVIACLQDPLLDWTDQEIESVIDYFNTIAELNSVAIVNFEDRFTYISDPSEVGDSSWVPSYNALNQKVDNNQSYVLGEIDRLDLRIDNLDFSNLIPQEVLDAIDANTAASHTHSNKSILDQVSQATLDAVSDNTDHRNDGTVHVTNTQKQDWDSRVTQQELTDGLDTKSDTDHTHEISDVDGLEEALDDLSPVPGPPGADGQSPIMQAGTIQDGEYFVEVDNSNPLLPILNLQVPAGEDGEDFHIDVFGNAGDRLNAIYDSEDTGFSYLGTDNGYLYFRKAFTDLGDPIPATSTQGWTAVQFMGYDGWSPILGVVVIDATKTVLALSGWIGGSGESPVIGTPGLPVYLGPSGFTQDSAQATNIRGNAGVQGEVGKAVFPDASGVLADRDNYDDELMDYMFYDSETGLMYIKRSDTTADWSDGYQWKGDTGLQGPPGEDGSGGGGSQNLQQVTDVGAITNNEITVPSLNFSAPDSNPEIGKLKFHSGEQSFQTITDKGNLIELGRTLSYRFIAQEAIAKGQPIYTLGVTIPGAFNVMLASATEYNQNWFVGIAGNSAAVGNTVEFIERGVVSGVDTSALTEGKEIYLGAAKGTLVSTRPQFPAAPIILGSCAYQDSVSGVLGVVAVKDNYNPSYDGCIIERHDTSVEVDTGVVYLDVEKLGGGDLPVQLGSGVKLLDCTSGTGIGGKARVALTQGSATAAVSNLIYIDLNGTTPELKSTSGYPITPFAFVAVVTIRDAASVLSEGAEVHRRITSAIAHDGRGSHSYDVELSTVKPATWYSGVTPTGSIDAGPTPDVMNLSVLAGVVYQRHRQDFPALNVVTNGIYVANGPGGNSLDNYAKLNNLYDAAGYIANASENRDTTSRGNLVIFGAINKTTSECKLYVNLPKETYGTNSNQIDNCYFDTANSAVYTIPDELRFTAFLIARIPYYINGNGNAITFSTQPGNSEVINLLGTPIGVAGGASGIGTFTPTLSQVLGEGNDAAGQQIKNILDGTDSQDATSLSQLQGRTRQRYDWNVGNLGVDDYKIQDLVVAGDLLCTPLVNDTQDDPNIVELEEDILVEGETFTTESNLSSIYSGMKITFNKPGWVRQVEVYAPSVDADITYKVAAVNITNPAVPIRREINSPVLTAGDWTIISLNNILVKAGEVYLIYLYALDSSSSTVFIDTWVSNGTGNNVIPDTPNGFSQNSKTPTVLRFDKTAIGQDRTSQLLGAIEGTDITVTQISAGANYFIFKTTSAPVNSGTYVELTGSVTELGEDIVSGETIQANFTVPVAKSTNYSEEVDYWISNQPSWADVEGLLYYGGVAQVATNNLYGVNIGRFVEVSLSSEYYYYPSVIGSGQGGDDGGGGDAAETAIVSPVAWDGSQYNIDLSVPKQFTLTVDDLTNAAVLGLIFPTDSNLKRREVIVVIDNSGNSVAIASISFVGGTWLWSVGDPVNGIAAGAVVELTLWNRSNDTVKALTDVEG